MPYVVKDRKPPEPWAEFRRRARHRWTAPLVGFDWLSEQVAYRLSRWSFLEVLEYAGSFSILIAAILYFAESGERRQQKHYQAWQVINTAQGKGGNGGRLDALRQLNEDDVALVGVDVSKAFLQHLALENANLRRATFRDADLRNARLRHAGLQDSDFTSANLREADVRDADLGGANFADADLTGADLARDNLHGANFDRADLHDVNLANVTDWKQIRSIRLANIDGVKNAPEGFVPWALAHGAVQIAATPQSKDAVRRATPESR